MSLTGPFTEFLELLIRDIGGKVLLVVDNVSYHTSREASDWVREREDRVELFFLPSCSPDLSPDEWVRKSVKHDHMARVVPQWPGHLFEIARRALRELRAAPEEIRAFFAGPHLAYISRACA